jgi:hypothetical protein
MAQKANAPLAPNLDLDQGYSVRFTAVDAASGADVTGVKVSNASLICANLTQNPAEQLQSGPFMLVPGPEN